MNGLDRFYTFFQKETNFVTFDCLLVPYHAHFWMHKTLLERDLLSKERISWSKFFPFKINSNGLRDANAFLTELTPLKVYPFSLNYIMTTLTQSVSSHQCPLGLQMSLPPTLSLQGPSITTITEDQSIYNLSEKICHRPARASDLLYRRHQLPLEEAEGS